MPDIDRLHFLSSTLARLTAPGEREPGLMAWFELVADYVRQISAMWSPKAAAADELYAALEMILPDAEEFGRRTLCGSPAGIEMAHAALLKANPKRGTDAG